MTNPSVDDILAGLRRGDRAVLARAITLVESTRPEHRRLAEAIVEQCLPAPSSTFRLGISGVPGVGKSTFIDELGVRLIGMDRRVAVLAIDPSSDISGGSILGDKTRMPRLAGESNAFIRPSPSAGRLGAVAHRTREAIFLCEAAGFDFIIVETVGAGQSETAVHSMVDCFLLLALAGAGDELQGIKRGIMEMADVVVITKADGHNEAAAEEARGQLVHALRILPVSKSAWKPRVLTTSALTGKGFDKVIETIEAYERHVHARGYFEERRRDQQRFWLRETIERYLFEWIYGTSPASGELRELESKVVTGTTSVPEAAAEFLSKYLPGSLQSEDFELPD